MKFTGKVATAKKKMQKSNEAYRLVNTSDDPDIKRKDQSSSSYYPLPIHSNNLINATKLIEKLASINKFTKQTTDHSKLKASKSQRLEDKLKGNRFSNCDLVKTRTPVHASKKTAKATPKHEENSITALTTENLDNDRIFVNHQSQRQSQRQSREKLILNSATLPSSPRIVKIWKGQVILDSQPSRDLMSRRQAEIISGTNGINTNENSHFITSPDQNDNGETKREMTPGSSRKNSVNGLQSNPGANLRSFRATSRRVNTYADINSNFIAKSFGGKGAFLSHNQNHNSYYNNSMNSLRHHKNRKTSMGFDIVAGNNEEINNKLVRATIGDPHF